MQVSCTGARLDIITAATFSDDSDGGAGPGMKAAISQQSAEQLVLTIPALQPGSYRLRLEAETRTLDAGSFYVLNKDEYEVISED